MTSTNTTPPDKINEWSRADLPAAGDLLRAVHPDLRPDLLPTDFLPVLDAVVDHLNAEFPKSRNWRRAHEIVEGERDQARKERDTAASEWRRQVERARVASDRALRAERERATATVRAVSAERERDEWKARAEAAEARTAPAVTKRELRNVVGAHDPGDDELAVSRINALTDRLWAWVSGDDPAVFVVRESDLPVAIFQDGVWKSGRSWEWMADSTPDVVRGMAITNLERAASCEAVARAIEAEAGQDVDPVEALADDFAQALAGDENIGGSWSMDPTAWRDITLTLARRAHAVLGQEASSDE